MEKQESALWGEGKYSAFPYQGERATPVEPQKAVQQTVDKIYNVAPVFSHCKANRKQC